MDTQIPEPIAETKAENRGNPRYLAFAQLLRETMEARGMNSSDLARAVWGELTDSRGYQVARNRDRIGHYLAGMSFPEDANLHRLADALGLPHADLAATRVSLGPTSSVSAKAKAPAPDEDTKLHILAHEPRHAILELKRRMTLGTAIRIINLLREEDQNGNGDADVDPPPADSN